MLKTVLIKGIFFRQTGIFIDVKGVYFLHKQSYLFQRMMSISGQNSMIIATIIVQNDANYDVKQC
jgi:hypothetical protein